MLITGEHLELLVDAGVVDAPRKHINAASVDVTLGDQFLIETPSSDNTFVRLRERKGLAMGRLTLAPDQELAVSPGSFFLAATAERLSLPDFVTAEFRLKSSVARMGMSHALAVWIDPGFHGVLTLELHNITQFHTVIVRPGDPIGQLIFHMHDTVPAHLSYRTKGNYNGAMKTQGAVPPRSVS